MNPGAEKDRQRKITLAYIESDPVTIVLTPWTESETSTGGTKRIEGTPRAPQTFKKIPMTFDQRPTITSAGVERIIDHTLLGAYDAVVHVGDHWTEADGSYFEVVALTEGFGYEVKALVERHVPKGA